MTRSSKLIIYICMAGLAAFFACSDKETPQPVEDTARLDALRAELRALRSQVLGLQGDYTTDSLTEKSLTAEIKRLNSVFSKTVQYTINVTDLQGNNLADANVKVTQAGAIVTAKTDANGLAKFDGLHGGNIAATVDAAGFATLIYTADIADYDTETAYTASSRVALIPVGGSAAADKGLYTLNLKLWANYTTQDDTLGGGFPGSDINFALPLGPNGNSVSYTAVTDKKVSIVLNQDYFNGISSSLFTTSGVGEVLSVSNENTTITATAATAGVYAIKVPARSQNFSFNYSVVFESFAHDYTTYVPGGSIKVDKPYDPTITTSKIFRLGYFSYSAELPGTVINAKGFYSSYNN